jgi:hypothetical protein
VARYKLTVRHGSDVERERFFSLDLALDKLHSRVKAISESGEAETVNAGVREFQPEEQVVARLEIRGQKLVRGPRAGVDLKGDGKVVPYRGKLFRRPLPGEDRDSAYAALREVLRSKRF